MRSSWKLLGRRARSVATLLVAAACGLSAALAEADAPGAGAPARAQVLEIGPRSVPCDDVVPRRCFEARRAGESEWSAFHGTIEGFAHREGHAYVLLVGVEDAPEAGGEGGAEDEGGLGRSVLVRVLAELPLGGASWVLERYGDLASMQDPLEHVDVAFAVRSGGTRIEGTAGCNDFWGPIAFLEDGIRIGPLATTLRACDEDVARQEALVLEALRDATRVTFYGDGVGFAGDDRRLRFGARLGEARLTWTSGPDDPELLAFNAAVDSEASGSASWTHDPVRVALAYVDSRGAPRVDIQRRDDRAEAPTSTLVTIDEDGFLDDSVRGVRSELILVPDARGTWRVLAVTVVTRCWRGERTVVGPGESCP
jgi:heat shock protein HslJ